MIGRVTNSQIYAGSLAAIQNSKSQISVLQQEAATGQAISKPSDNPTGTAQALQVRSAIAANTQYSNNISDGLGWLATTDSAMTTAQNLISQAKDLMVQGANGSVSAAGRAAIASQLQGVQSSLLAAANTQYLGRSVFAGTSDAAAAFASDGTYNGVVDANGAAYPVTRQVANGQSITVSADGASAFGTLGAGGTAGTSVFAQLNAVISALNSPTYATDGSAATVTAGIDQMASSLTRMTTQHAVVGSSYALMQAAQTQNSSTATSLAKQQTSIEGADATQVLVQLKTQELAYQAALQVTASTLQPTLMSYLQQ